MRCKIGTRARGPSSSLIVRARNALALGDLDGAEGRLAALSPNDRRMASQIALLRAEIALVRGDHEAVITHEGEILAAPVPRFHRAADGVVRAEARALGALARALARKGCGSAEAVLASAWAGRQAVSRALLAEAFAKEEPALLATHLETHRRAILSGATRSERALLHGLEERYGARTHSGYRSAGRTATNADDLALWEATRHRGARNAPRSPGAARDELRRARARASRGARARRGRRALLFALVVVSALSIGACFGATAVDYFRVVAAVSATSVPLLLFLSARARAIHEAALCRAERLAARGEIAEARAAAKNVDDRGDVDARTRAKLLLAMLDERDGDFTIALGHIDAAIAEINRRRAEDVVLAELIARRARLLAVLGRRAEAEAELEILQTSFTSAIRPEAQLGARLVLAVAARDLDALGSLARERTPGMLLDASDDTLCDLALAATGSLDAASLRCLREDLARDPLLSAHVDTVAPGLRASALGEAREPDVRIALPAPSEEEDAASSEEGESSRRAARK